jgi:hypothetical protein
MKKTTFAALFLCLAGVLLPSLEKENFDGLVDFSLDIKAISKIIQDPGFDLSAHGRAVIFDGSVAGIEVINPDPAEFAAEIELVGGEWEGLEKVSLYRVFVYVQGPEFARRLSGESPGAIARHNRVLVAGTIAGAYEDETGALYALILAYHVRVIP